MEIYKNVSAAKASIDVNYLTVKLCFYIFAEQGNDMYRKLLILTIWLCLCPGLEAQIVTSYDRPSRNEFKKAVNVVLHQTTCSLSDKKTRIKAMRVIQCEMNNFPPEQWRDYTELDRPDRIAALERSGTLYFYRKAMEKVLDELESTVVSHGHMVMWNLYNMGYIIKTPSHVFCIDLVHKHMEDFTQYLDFALITHRHRDHGSSDEFEAFASAGVPVYAGYLPSEKPETLEWNFVEDGETFTIDGITITGKRADHHKDRGFQMITVYEIDCGDDTGNTVVYHSGDACDYEQFESQKSVDFFIFHTAVGLDIQRAIDKIKPEYAIFSHAWELAHKIEKYRWTIDDLLDRSSRIVNFPAERILLPCWGEKIVYSK